MFGAWAHLASPPEDLTEKERSPPPPPTQLDFPKYYPQNPARPLTPASSIKLFRLLCAVRKPSDITPQLLQILNISVTPDRPLSDLLSRTTTSAHDDLNPTKPNRDRLSQTVLELRCTHTTAFREVIRLPPLPGQPRIRLTHTRKFWAGLEKMAQYWDYSADQFYHASEPADGGSSSSGSESDTDMADASTKTSVNASDPIRETPKTKLVYKGRRLGTGSSMPATYREETVSALVESVVWAYTCQVRCPGSPPRLAVRNLLFPVRQSYIVGRLPKDRNIARKGILEGPIMGICCRVETDFHPAADSSDSERVEQGTDQASTKEEWKAALDLSREVAVMLLLAQERVREGQTEVKPGEGKWWTTTPRWGGGPGGLMESEILTEKADMDEKSSLRSSQQDIPPVDDGTIDSSPSSSQEQPPPPSSNKRKANGDTTSPTTTSAAAGGGIRISSGSRHKKGSSSSNSNSKQTLAEKWRTLRPGLGTWDAKMKYTRTRATSASQPSSTFNAVGVEPQPDVDQIFMVSSLNHHVALLRMDVSTRYLAWLGGEEEVVVVEKEPKGEAGSGKGGMEGEQKKDGLHMQRSRWFDLFDDGDRVEFVEGLWQVMDCLVL